MGAISIAGKEVTLRPVKVGMIKALWPTISAPGDDLPANIDVMVDFVHAAAAGAVTREALFEASLPDLIAAFDASMEVSGLSRRKLTSPGATSP